MEIETNQFVVRQKWLKQKWFKYKIDIETNQSGLRASGPIFF